MCLFYITKFHPRRVLETVHHLLCPPTSLHPQSSFRAKTPFQDTPPDPSLHISYSPFDDARAQCHTSPSFQGPKSECLHQNLATTHPYADTSQISLRGSCCDRQQIDS